jgi:hypothetical protein
VKDVAQARDDHPAPPEAAAEAHSGDPTEAWIHSLAGEWQTRWERVQNPQALSGASLFK